MRSLNKKLRYIGLAAFVLGVALAASSAMLAQGKVGIEIGPSGIRYAYDEKLWVEGVEDYEGIKTLDVTGYDIPVYIEEGNTGELSVDYFYRGEETELTMKKDGTKLIVEKAPSNNERFISMGIAFDDQSRQQMIKVFLPKGQKLDAINAKTRYLNVYGASVGKLQNITDKGFTNLSGLDVDDISIIGPDNHTVLSDAVVAKTLKVSSLIEDNVQRKINGDNGYLELTNVTAATIDTKDLFQASVRMDNVKAENDFTVFALQNVEMNNSNLKAVAIESAAVTLEDTTFDGALQLAGAISNDTFRLNNVEAKSLAIEGEYVDISKSTIKEDIVITKIINNLNIIDTDVKSIQVSNVETGSPVTFENLKLANLVIEGDAGYATIRNVEAEDITVGAEQVQIESSTIHKTLTVDTKLNHNSFARVKAENFILNTVESDTKIRNSELGTTTIHAEDAMVQVAHTKLHKNTDIVASSVFIGDMNSLDDLDVKFIVPEGENIFIPGESNVRSGEYVREKTGAKKLHVQATDGSINIS